MDEQRGGEPSRAVTLSRRERAWVIDKLMGAGHDDATIMRCVDQGCWGELPVTADELRSLTCRSCGAKPWRTAAGRLMLGCAGQCQQKMFADLKDDAVQARAGRLAQMASGEAERPAAPPKRTGLWQDLDE